MFSTIYRLSVLSQTFVISSRHVPAFSCPLHFTIAQKYVLKYFILPHKKMFIIIKQWTYSTRKHHLLPNKQYHKINNACISPTQAEEIYAVARHNLVRIISPKYTADSHDKNKNIAEMLLNIPKTRYSQRTGRVWLY